MAIITLPLAQNTPWYDFSMPLDQTTYTVEMAFNTRANRWMLTLGDVSGSPIVYNLPVVIQRDLLLGLHHLPVPPGYLVAIDLSGQNTQPDAGAFLLNHRLYYIEKGTQL